MNNNVKKNNWRAINTEGQLFYNGNWVIKSSFETTNLSIIITY